MMDWYKYLWPLLAGFPLSTSKSMVHNPGNQGGVGLVDKAPSFTNQLNNISVPVERDVTFTCNVKNIGHYKVGWVNADTKAIQAIDDQIITHNSRVSVSGDFVSTFNLHIKQVRRDDAGSYMCQINTDPHTFQSAHLSVKVPPDIDMTRTSGDITAREHTDTAQLVCSAHGVPKPKISWRREGGLKIRDKHTRRMVEIVNSDRLEIHKVRREDMGAYLCIASNDVPPAVSKRIYLRVQFPPYILPGLSVLGTAEGEKLTLECIVESYPQSFVVWSKGDRILHAGGGPGYTVSEVPLSMYRVTSKLTLTSYTRAQAGPYKCLGKNSLGEAELTTRVYTTEPEQLVPRKEVRYELIPEENLEEQKKQKEVVIKKEKTKKEQKSKWTLPDSTKSARDGSERKQNQRKRHPAFPSSGAYQQTVSLYTIILVCLFSSLV